MNKWLLRQRSKRYPVRGQWNAVGTLIDFPREAHVASQRTARMRGWRNTV